MRHAPEEIEIDMMKGGDYINRLGKSNEIQQNEVAALTGISPAMIHKLIHHRSVPGLEVMARLCYSFGVDFNDLARAYGLGPAIPHTSARLEALRIALMQLPESKADELVDRFVNEANRAR